MATSDAVVEYPHHRPWYTVLYVQVLIAIAVGILIGSSRFIIPPSADPGADHRR